MEGQVRGSVVGSGSVSDNIVAKIPLIQKGPVVGLEVMGQTVWVVYQLQSYVHAHPVTLTHQPQTFSIQGLLDPYDIVRFPPGQLQLAISDTSKQLLWVKLQQRDGVWKLTSQRSMKVRYDPWGLGVRDNQLLVCDHRNISHVLSTSGEESEPAVAQLTSPGFVIRDPINKQVVLVTEEGEIQQAYQGQEGIDRNDIVCHGHSIYVTDLGNNCVHELSADGHQVRQLIRGQGVRQFGSMCVDDTGRLYVAHVEPRKNEVWVIETTVIPTDTQATPGDRILTQQTNMNLSVTWCN